MKIHVTVQISSPLLPLAPQEREIHLHVTEPVHGEDKTRIRDITGYKYTLPEILDTAFCQN